MGHSKNLDTSPPLKKLPSTSLSEQYRRQRISDTWEPLGFDRYQYQRALLHEMNVLGGVNDLGGPNPDRYASARQLEEEFPIR